eukprot:294642-Rhodomonas_salina.2
MTGADIVAQLNDLVAEMRKELNSQQRKKVNTLVIIDVVSLVLHTRNRSCTTMGNFRSCPTCTQHWQCSDKAPTMWCAFPARARHRGRLRARFHPGRARVRMGVAAAILLGQSRRRAFHPAVHIRDHLRIRVHGPQRPTCDHPADRSMLHDADASPELPAWRSSGRASWDWEDRNRQRLGQGNLSVRC